ncbi:glycosyltransferase family 4 protein [Georgenia daeguensis]|uniref:D-inositol 3-phosphate glycosyltransferase n=1 Tax=Georgenia daeguensis TaxID=908355 RepID=A0ABP8EYR6_9MICO
MAGFPEYLVEQGWDVQLLSGPGGGSTEQFLRPGVTTFELPMLRRPSPVGDVRSLLGWIRHLRRYRPDVAVLATPKAALLGLLAAKGTGVPARIYHLYGLRLETTRGAFRALLWLFEWVSARSATRVLSVSPSLTRAFTAHRLARPEKIDMLGSGSSHGVDMAWFSPQQVDESELARLRDSLGLTGGRRVVGFVGRLAPDKGLETLAAAVELLAIRSVDVDVLVVGGVDRAGYDPFDSVTRRPVRVDVVEDTRPYFRLMDVLCLPTLREGMPNVCLEAAAMGVPVVTTTATGAVDSILDGRTGIAVPPADPVALAAALESLALDPKLASSLGARGRTWVHENFSRPRVWAALDTYFQGQLTQGSREPDHAVGRGPIVRWLHPVLLRALPRHRCDTRGPPVRSSRHTSPRVGLPGGGLRSGGLPHEDL